MKKIAVILLASAALMVGQVEAHSLTQSKCADITELLINEGYTVILIDEAPAAEHFTASALEFKIQDLATLPLEYLIEAPHPVYVVPASIGTPDTKRHNAWVARVLKLC